MPTYTTDIDLLRAVTAGDLNSDQLNVNVIASVVPTGSATAAKQDTGNTSLASIDGKLTTLNSQTDGVEGPLSSIDTKLSSQATAANQTTGNTSLTTIGTNTLPLIGKTTSATLTNGSGHLDLDCAGMGTGIVEVTGTWTGSINFYKSIDGTVFTQTANGVDVLTLDGQVPTSTTTDSNFKFSVTGYKTLRMFNNISTGSAVVTMRVAPAASVIDAVLAPVYIGNSGFSVNNTAGSGAAKVTANYATRSDTYTTTANGTTVDISTWPLKSFSISVKGTGASATTWDIRLEGSNDNVNFTQILGHTNTTGDGVTLFPGASLSPCLYFRSRCAGLVLGGATNVVVKILGVS